MKSENQSVGDPSLWIAALLIALTAMGQVSIALYVPSMPAIAADFGRPVEAVTLTLTVFFVAFSFAQLAYGPLSDRFGRRRVLIGGTALYVGASALCMLAPSLEWLAAARFAQAFGACAGPVLGRAMVRDIYGGERAVKVMAYIGMAFSVSPAVTPAIGGFLQVAFGWRANFVFLTVFGLAMLAATLWRLPETFRPRPEGGVGAMLANYRFLLGERVLVGYSLAAGLLFGGMMAFTALSPFLFIDRLGITPDLFGILIIVNTLGMVGGQFVVSRLAHRARVGQLVGWGIAIAGAAGLTMLGLAAAGWMNAVAILAPMTVFMFGTGLVVPTAMAAALAPHPRMAGTASAVMGFVQMVVAAVATRVSGWLPHDDQLPMAGLILAATALAALAFRLIVPRPAG